MTSKNINNNMNDDNKSDENNDKNIKNNYYYMCKRCSYKTNFICDIKKHLDRKTKCISKDENYNLTDEELYNISLKKEYSENNIKKSEKTKKDKNDNNKKENNNICEYCENSYYNKQGLERHLKICKKKNINNNLNIHNNDNISNNNNNENSKNITHTTSLTQNNYYHNTNIETQNNLILNLPNQNLKEETMEQILVPFFDKFDTSHINDDIKMGLLLSHLYYDTLKEIMKNSVNLNFLLDANQKSGLIYKNGEENLVPIDNIIIYNNVWRKVRDYLLEALESMKNKYPKTDDNLYNHLQNQIKNKYNEFIKDNNKDYTVAVKETINKIANERKEEIENRFKILSNYNLLKD